MKRLTVICLALSGCSHISYRPGTEYTAPISVPLSHAQATTAKVYSTGSKPKDPQVKTIINDLDKAQKATTTLTKTVDTMSKQHAEDTITKSKQAHRIFIDDCIFAVPILLLGGFMLIKLLPLLAL